MSIDEAIAHAKEKAYEHKERAKHFDTVDNKNMCLECAEEHEQLAEWLIKLKEYQTLEEQGRLIKLPCKVGTDVYYILGIPNETPCAIDKCVFELSDIHKIGKTLFLTREEAEAKLEELRGSND